MSIVRLLPLVNHKQPISDQLRQYHAAMLNTNLRMLQQAPWAGTGMHPTLYPDAYLVLLTSPAMFVWLEIYAYIYPDAASYI